LVLDDEAKETGKKKPSKGFNDKRKKCQLGTAEMTISSDLMRRKETGQQTRGEEGALNASSGWRLSLSFFSVNRLPRLEKKKFH